MGRLIGVDPVLYYAWVNLRGRIAKVRSGEMERGASAVEWVVISMIVVTMVVAIGFVIQKALNGRATQVGACIQTNNGTTGKC